jgi:hypothetical protein
MEHSLDHAGAFGARNAQPVVNDVGQVGTGQRARLQSVRTGNPRISHNLSPPPEMRHPALVITLPQSPGLGNSAFARISLPFNSEARPLPK